MIREIVLIIHVYCSILFWFFWFMRATVIQLVIIAKKNVSIIATFASYPHDYTCAFGGKFTVDYELFVMGIKVPRTNV